MLNADALWKHRLLGHHGYVEDFKSGHRYE